MKVSFVKTILILLFVSGSASATEYIYRDLMANSIPSTRCEAKVDAIARVKKPSTLRVYSKKFCQTQGYGWHVEEVKQNGEVTCNECNNNVALQACYLKDVVVTCKRIKPGSVGMLPGKG